MGALWLTAPYQRYLDTQDQRLDRRIRLASACPRSPHSKVCAAIRAGNRVAVRCRLPRKSAAIKSRILWDIPPSTYRCRSESFSGCLSCCHNAFLVLQRGLEAVLATRQVTHNFFRATANRVDPHLAINPLHAVSSHVTNTTRICIASRAQNSITSLACTFSNAISPALGSPASIAS